VNLREFNRVLRQTLLLPILLLLALAGFAAWQILRSASALQAIDRSDEFTTQLIELQKLIIDQETGLRGFQLTSDPAMLAPYQAAMGSINKSFDSLHQQLSGRANQNQRLAVARDRYQLWLGFAESLLNKDPATLKDPQLNQRGKHLMDNVRAAMDDLLKAEAHVRKRRSDEALGLERHEFITLVAVALVVGILLGLFTRSRLRHVSRTYDATLLELKMQAEEIYERGQWLQTTLESIGDAVVACDNEGRVVFMNAVAEALTGWTGQEALGRQLREVFRIVNEETREEAENPVDKVRRLQTVAGLANHTALISRQGKEYVVDDSAAPIRGQDGEMTGIVLVFRDVTDAHRTEAALIAGEKLAIAGRLAASIAHEIHNPLDSVANLHFLMADEADPEKRAEYLHLAQQEVNRTMQISRTLLSLYREPKAPVPVDLKELAEGVLLLLERRLLQQNIHVDRDYSEPCVVEGFPAELRQVFTNILVNALEAAGNNGRIRVRIDHAPAEELRCVGVLVEVTDSGPGISEQAEQNLFQPFFTTKGEEGTGLGLWVSKGIVQKHGGTIRIANSHDEQLRGACVRVYLPARTMASASTRATAHVA
jgi:PAS domain S-box-containing protein